ncbi:MAG: rhomboid family intramembrane serine protease [Desulfotalea sp.]
MLILPVFTKTDKKSLPLVCLTLIILNALIFFILQADDGNKHKKAFQFYHSSGLNNIELNAYQTYLVDRGIYVPDESLKKPQRKNALTIKMLADDKFTNLLENNKIITSNNKIFKKWRSKRDQFKSLKDQIMSQRFGYSPSRGNYVALFTCMFLHGGIMHLIGNMAFLWLVGAILEKTLGGINFIVLYILTGIFASLAFGLANPSSPGPLIGASGAISGLMGAYGIIFGMRKIRVFYSLGFYFNYANIPAITLFPVWLIIEIFRLITNKGSNVAYMAHIGGLLSGICIGLVYRYYFHEKIDSIFKHEDDKGQIEELLGHGMEKVFNLELQKARKDFKKVLSHEPHNQIAIRQLFDIDKTTPHSPSFHQSCHRLLAIIPINNMSEYLNIFEEYKQKTGAPQLTKDILERLCYGYLTTKNLKNASKCVSVMAKRYPENSLLPGYLKQLGNNYLESNNQVDAKKCFSFLCKKYPASTEGTEGKEILFQLNSKSLIK